MTAETIPEAEGTDVWEDALIEIFSQPGWPIQLADRLSEPLCLSPLAPLWLSIVRCKEIGAERDLIGSCFVYPLCNPPGLELIRLAEELQFQVVTW